MPSSEVSHVPSPATNQPVISVAPAAIPGGIYGEGGGFIVVPIPSHAIETFFIIGLAALSSWIFPKK